MISETNNDGMKRLGVAITKSRLCLMAKTRAKRWTTCVGSHASSNLSKKHYHGGVRKTMVMVFLMKATPLRMNMIIRV
jgi:hypothetical protein